MKLVEGIVLSRSFFFCMSGIFVSLCPTDLHLFLRFPICVISSHSSVNAIHDISHTMSHIPFIGSRYKWLHSFYLIYSYCHIEIVANPRSGGYTHLPVLQSVSMLSHHTKFQFDSYALSSAQHPYLHLHVVSGRVWSVAMCLSMCVQGLSACPCLASSYRYAVVCEYFFVVRSFVKYYVQTIKIPISGMIADVSKCECRKKSTNERKEKATKIETGL